MNIRFLSLLFSQFFTSLVLLGQTSEDKAIKVDIIPPSPNALALGKYGEIPVNHYTGIPNIDIPLYTINSNQIELPVSLSYHAGGHRVTENASWVGLGWSLNAGGVITRTVRGLPDEVHTGLRSGFNHNRELALSFYNRKMSAQEELLFLQGLADGQQDAEPDEYFFNFNGKSGRFIIDVNGLPVITPYQNIKIDLIGDDISLGFKLTDEYGTLYTFDSREMTESTDACELIPLGAFPSSWYLSSIEPVNGSTIYFSYDSGLIYQDFLPSESVYTMYASTTFCRNIYIRDCVKETKIYTKRLSQISWNGGKILFKAQTKRTDLFKNSDDYRLDFIELHGQQLVKKFALQYNDIAYQKLFLTKLIEVDIDNQKADKSHIFTYNSQGSVPSVTSKAQDHWGYHNDNRVNTLVPKDVFYSLGKPQVLQGADRSPSESRTQIGIINSIKYPTGAQVDFGFELNNYGFQRQEKVQEYLKEDMRVNLDANVNQEHDYASFKIDFTQIVNIYGSVNIGQDGGLQPNYNEYAVVTGPGGKKIYSNIGGNRDQQTELEPGIYEVTVHSENPNSATSISVFYQRNSDKLTKTFATGGLRIKTITKRENNIVVEKNEYQYVMEDESDRSSGVVMGLPQYHYYYNIYDMSSSCSYYVRTSIGQTLGSTKGGNVGYRNVRVIKDDELINDYAFTSFYEYPDVYSLGFPFAPPMSSDYLRGMLLSSKSKKMVAGKLVDVRTEQRRYKFQDSNSSEFFGIKVGYRKRSPNPVLSDFEVAIYSDQSSWMVQDSAIIIDFDLNGKNPVRTYTKYHYDNPKHIQLSRLEKGGSGNYKEQEFYLYADDYNNGTAIINAMKSRHLAAFPIEKVKIRSYDNQSYIVSSTLNEYDPLGKGLLKSRSIMTSLSPLITADFKFSNRLKGVVPPVGAQSVYQPDEQYKVAYKVLVHDIYGNPQEIKKQEEPSTAYLWGYGGQYPIAEIKNATYADVLAVLTPATINNLNAVNVTETTVTNAMNKLRTDSRLSKAMVTSYTYQPLVGMKSKTDPRGVTEYYEYDGMQRLKAVLDQVKNVTTSMDYHYRSN